MQPAEFVPDPIDFQQLELLGRLPPAHRVRAMLATEQLDQGRASRHAQQAFSAYVAA